MRTAFSVRAAALLLLAALLWAGLGAPLTGSEWADVPARAERALLRVPAQGLRVWRCWLAFPAASVRVGTPDLNGGLALKVWDDARHAAAYLPLEDYVLGAVAAEMPVSYDPEALKCQAVAARTRALWSCVALGGSGCARHPDCDLCTDSACCQGYAAPEVRRLRWGDAYAVYAARLDRAVSDTAGELLTYDGLPIEMLYHACSGGMTEDAEAVFAHALPYLRSVPSPGEESSSGYASEAVFTRREAADRLLAAFPDCGVTADSLPGALERVSSTASGRVRSARVGSVTVTGPQLRRALGLQSAWFTWDADDDALTFHVRGYGHGVGMSQAGAQAMAASGSDYRAILAHYYPGAALTVLHDPAASGE